MIIWASESYDFIEIFPITLLFHAWHRVLIFSICCKLWLMIWNFNSRKKKSQHLMYMNSQEEEKFKHRVRIQHFEHTKLLCPMCIESTGRPSWRWLNIDRWLMGSIDLLLCSAAAECYLLYAYKCTRRYKIEESPNHFFKISIHCHCLRYFSQRDFLSKGLLSKRQFLRILLFGWIFMPIFWWW